MKKILCILMIGLISGCTATLTPPVQIGQNLPLDLSGTRVAKKCSFYILGFIGPFGDRSIAKTARENRISKIIYYEQFGSYYILWGNKCNIIYGH